MEENVPKHVEIYTLERAQAFGRNPQELRVLLGEFTLFLNKETTALPNSLGEWQWIDDNDQILVENDPRVIATQDERVKRQGSEDYLRQRCRSMEWAVLLEKFIEVVPVADASTNAA